MLRNILGVIVGYAAMFIFVMVTFTILYLLLARTIHEGSS